MYYFKSSVRHVQKLSGGRSAPMLSYKGVNSEKCFSFIVSKLAVSHDAIKEKT